MKGKKKCRDKPNPFSKGEMNKIIDALVHPLFDKSKAFVLVDGVLHGVVEENPPVSMKKFVRYNFPELMRARISPGVKLGGKKRHYSCELSMNYRYMICNRKKAGYQCLETGVWKSRCKKLIITYR